MFNTINMFKNIRMYRLYRSLLKKNEKELLEKFNLRLDRVGRLYTVVNLPPQTDTYGPKDGPRITAALLKNWLNKLDNYLVSIGVKEFTTVESMNEIDEMNYLLIIRFKYLNMPRIATNAVIISSIVGALTIISTIVFVLIKLFM